MNTKEHLIIKKIDISIRCFIGGLIIAMAAILPVIIKSHGYFALLNDFSAGAIPQQMLMNWSIKNDGIWNWGIDLGGNWIENLGWVGAFSPFSLATYLFKPTTIPKIIGYFVIIKYACAALTSSLFFRRHFSDDKLVFLGSMLYAFSGYQCCSIDFYFFQDVVVFFPLLLVGLELLVEEGKRGVLCIAVILNILANFVFFVGEVFFLIIYFGIIYILFGDKSVYKVVCKIRDCVVEGIIGGLTTGIIIIPFVNNLLGNARANSYLKWYDWFTVTTTDVLSLIQAYFMPAQAMNNGASVYSTNWMTRTAYIPVFGAVLVLAYILKKKHRDKYSILMVTLILFSVVPLFNGLFFNFSETRYNRWFYMITLIESMISLMVLEDIKAYPVKKSSLIASVIVVIYSMIVLLVNRNEQIIFNKKEFFYQLVAFFIGIIIVMVCLKIRDRSYMYKLSCGVTAVFCIISLYCTVAFYQQVVDNSEIDFKEFDNEVSEALSNYLTGVTSKLERVVLPYRYYFDEGIGYTYYNLAMTYDLPSTNSFLSTITNSIFELYESYGTNRQVMTPYGQIGNQELLGAKYIVSQNYNEAYELIDTITDKNGQTFYLMNNPYAIAIGSIYDSYISKEEYMSLDPSVRAVAMIQSLVVDDTEIEKVSKILRHNDDYMNISLDDLLVSCLSKQTGYDYLFESNKVEIKFDTADGAFILVSIPYDKYWNVTVNGKDEQVLKINGLMAVRVPVGTSVVSFEYQYAPIKWAMGASVLGLVSFIVYLLFYSKKGKNK